MANFLDSTKISTPVPKIMETQSGYIFNGIMYDKKSYVAESLDDFISSGSTRHIAVDRVAHYPVQTGTGANALIPTMFRGSTIIPDNKEKNIYYQLTFDYEKEINKSYSSITVIYDDGTNRKKLRTSYENATSAGWYGGLTEYIGQSDTTLFFISDMGYSSGSGTSQYTRSYLTKIDKATLIRANMENSGSDRNVYAFLKETDAFIYIAKRGQNAVTVIYELDKQDCTLKTVMSLPAFTGELTGSDYLMPIEMASENKGYIAYSPSINGNDTVRWVDFTFDKYHRAINKNGYPNVVNLRAEADYTLEGYQCYNNYKTCPVLDKDNIGGTTHTVASTFYWNTANDFLDITFHEEVNIWRAGVTSYPGYITPFTIEKWDDSTDSWSVVTNTITQTLTQLNSTQWEKTISNLPAGRYKFKATSRMDSCWYIEKTSGNDYIGELSAGLMDVNSVQYDDIQYTVQNPDLSLKEIHSSNCVARRSFTTDCNGIKYLNIVNFGLSQTEWGTSHYEKSHITTFRIDEENKGLELVSQVPLSNSTSVCKSFVLDSKNKRLLGMSGDNTFLLEFDETSEKFIAIKYFPYTSLSCGFDKKNNIWILNNDYELLKLHDNIPEKINIEFESSNLEYEGDEISTYIEIEAINFLNDRLDSKISLSIGGNARFDETGTNTITVETSSVEKCKVPLTIYNSGIIAIYPTLILDLKQS